MKYCPKCGNLIDGKFECSCGWSGETTEMNEPSQVVTDFKTGAWSIDEMKSFKNIQASMDEDRLKHSFTVANKMVEIGKSKDYTEDKLKDLFLLGLVHDIGFAFGGGATHHKVGSDILKNNNYKYWEEVLNHGFPDAEYKSDYLDILNAADMMTDKFGNLVGFNKRLEDIKGRYGEESEVYQNCLKLISKLKELGY